MNLRIAFMAHDAAHTETLFREFVKANADEARIIPDRSGRLKARFSDGTEVFVVYPYANLMLGMRFDQVILAGKFAEFFCMPYEIWQGVLMRCSGQVPLIHACMFWPNAPKRE